MKTINKIFMTLGVAATAMGFSSCVNDLDLSPINPNERVDVTQDMDAVFADIYLNFSTYGPNGDTPIKGFDGGKAAFQRAVYTGECMTTDESCWLWDPGEFGTTNYGYMSPDIDICFAMYFRLLVNASLCNQFIANASEGGSFAEAGSDKAQEFIRQAKILRAFCYFYQMSWYENPPYCDENTLIGQEPSQPGRDKMYEYATTQLEEIVKYYKDNNKTDVFYGFVGLDAAESLLAKFYLNGEVWAGRVDYDKCYQHSKAVIDRLGKGGKYNTGLAYSYQALFGYNNAQYVLGNPGNEVNEIIWTIPASKVKQPDLSYAENLTAWSGSTFMVAGWANDKGVQSTVPNPTMDPLYKTDDINQLVYTDDNGVKRVYKYFDNQEDYDDALKTYKDAKEWEKTVTVVEVGSAWSYNPEEPAHVAKAWYNSNDGWGCMVARKAFVKKFDWLDVEMSVSNDRRVALWQTSKNGFTANNISLVGDDWGKNGYLAIKYSNWAYNEDGTINYIESPNSVAPYGGDYAAIRLAEVYLMAAEAILQGGGGSQAEALQYVNNVRQRAYADKYTPWTSLNMSALQDERARELYSENVRRTDLIRWGQWTNGYTWEWKGGIANGQNLQEYQKSFPLPTRVIQSSSLQQQKGY